MPDYRRALETSQRNDTPHPDDLWAWFSPAIAAQPVVRISRNWREYREKWERRLDPRHRPEQPAAVRTYDQAGQTRCVVFDLDAKKPGQRGTVLRDCTRIAAWLSEAGCAYFIDESPSGGRHVYVPLDHAREHGEIAPLLKALRSGGFLPTLDPGPMANLTQGCIRPPGATHKSGGHQRLVTELHTAAATLAQRTTRAAWDALTAMLPTEPVTNDDIRATLAAVPEGARPGRPLPLRPYFARMAVTGEYDTARYASPSQARGAIVLHAVGRGWGATDIRTEVEAGRWPGLVRLYEDKYRSYAATALFGRGEQVHGDIRRAQEHLAANPLRKSLTSAPRPRRGLPAHETRMHLRRWYAAVELALADHRWNSRASYGRENVLTALASAARQVQAVEVEYGARHLSYTGGAVLDWSSVAMHLRALREEEDPFILLVEADRGVGADVYELVIPARYRDRLPPDDELPALPRGIHPVFGQLSLPAYRLWTALNAARRPVKAAEVAEAAHMPVRTAWGILAELEIHHLASRGGGGTWRPGRRSLDRVARDLGVPARLRKLVDTWRLERDAWRIAIGMAPRELPPARNVAWPGRAARPSTTDPITPSTVPTEPWTRDRELASIGGGEPDWRTNLEEATAILLLQQHLGAQVISDRAPPGSEAVS